MLFQRTSNGTLLIVLWRPQAAFATTGACRHVRRPADSRTGQRCRVMSRADRQASNQKADGQVSIIVSRVELSLLRELSTVTPSPSPQTRAKRLDCGQ
ncbi:hypothetical protein LSAT2_015027, partial [Lamellibrachia satsuma]